MPTVKNFLIDLGDVLYAIDLNRSIQIWNQMAPNPQKGVNFTKEAQHELFSQLDKGTIEITDFAAELKQAYQLNGTIDAIVDGWRQLLIGLIPGRLEGIQRLSKRYKLALLSNTNAYHYSVYKEECAPIFSCFDHLYFSFEMGMRKPDAEIYLSALEQSGWKAEETVFLDDSQKNIDGANKVGIQTVYMHSYEVFDQVLANYLP